MPGLNITNDFYAHIDHLVDSAAASVNDTQPYYLYKIRRIKH